MTGKEKTKKLWDKFHYKWYINYRAEYKNKLSYTEFKKNHKDKFIKWMNKRIFF